MTGDTQDIVARLKAVLPAGWFADTTPVLDGLLTGLANGWAFLYAQLHYAMQQTRIATATDIWLDMIAQDFFSDSLQRRAGESDTALRTRIQRALLPQRATRPALIAALQSLTGRTPTIFEPANPADTGAWNLALGYGTAGGWGSLKLPCQCFVTAPRAPATGIALVGGYGTGGPSEYGSLAMAQAQVSDADILATIAATMPAAAIAWTRLTD